MRDLGCLCVFVLQFSDALLDRFTALLRWEMAEVVADRTLALRPGGAGVREEVANVSGRGAGTSEKN